MINAGIIPDPKYGRMRECREFEAPEVKLDPHVAPLGMKFYTGDMFPAQYRQQIFITEFFKLGGAGDLKNYTISPRNGYPSQPVVAVGAIVFKNDRVLLVRRGQPPSQDMWAIPGGRVKIGETLQEAAEREIFEETGITIQARDPVYTFDYIERDGSALPRFHYVIIDLVAEYVRGKTRAGDDAAEVRWVSVEELDHLNVSSKTIHLLKTHYDFGQGAKG